MTRVSVFFQFYAPPQIWMANKQSIKFLWRPYPSPLLWFLPSIMVKFDETIPHYRRKQRLQVDLVKLLFCFKSGTHSVDQNLLENSTNFKYKCQASLQNVTLNINCCIYDTSFNFALFFNTNLLTNDGKFFQKFVWLYIWLIECVIS